MACVVNNFEILIAVESLHDIALDAMNLIVCNIGPPMDKFWISHHHQSINDIDLLTQ